jgi:hypothetical protein
MGETIQTGRSQQGFTEEIGPFFGGTIAGEQDATPLVSFVDDVVEVFRGRGEQWLESEVVEYQQIRTQVGLKPSFQSGVGTPAVDVLEHLVGVDEQDGVASAAGLVGQGLGEVGFDAPIDMPPLGRMLSAM